MRKYRGKSIADVWIFGNLICQLKERKNYIYQFEYEPEYNYIFEDDGVINGKVVYVLDKTIGQYSGVKDKNGVEMYEGDIVYGAAHWLERYKPAVVTFRNGSFGLLWHRGSVEEFNPFTSLCNVEYEVVGNIYDNPELMEE